LHGPGLPCGNPGRRHAPGLGTGVSPQGDRFCRGGCAGQRGRQRAVRAVCRRL